MKLIRILLVCIMTVPMFMSKAHSIALETLTPEQLMDYGQKLYDDLDYGSAAGAYDTIVFYYPASPLREEAMYKWIVCYLNNGDSWEVLKGMDRFLVQYPSSKYAEEVKKYQKMLKNIVRGNREQPKYSISNRIADNWIGSYYPDFYNLSMVTGQYGNEYRPEQFDTAMYWLDKCIERAPKTVAAAKAQYTKGELYLKQDRKEDYLKAVAEYQKVIDEYFDIEPYYAGQAGIKIAVIYQDYLRDKDKAINAYKAIVDKFKNDLNNYFVRYAQTQIAVLSE